MSTSLGNEDATGPRSADGESIAESLSAIRELVSAETKAHNASRNDDEVLMLTKELRVPPSADAGRFGEVLTEGLNGPLSSAPILDEAALRSVVNTVVREELQGEMGDRISRNVRKLIRQELSAMLEERDAKPDNA